MIDAKNAEILRLIQPDATLTVAEVAKRVGLTEQECADRIESLERDGVIKARVTLLDPKKAGTGVTVFVAITLLEHDKNWLVRFHDSVQALPEVAEFYRMSGAVDYLLRVTVSDIDGYDDFYKKLIEIANVKDISSTFAMEQIKFTTELPLRTN